MGNLIAFIVGFIVSFLFFNKEIRISVHHKHEEIKPLVKTVDLEEIEKKMLEEDPKMDEKYERFESEQKDISDVLAEVSDIMGGSDR